MLVLALLGSALMGGPTLLPDVRVTTQTGAELRPSGWRGEPVVVAVWATWCTHCQEELRVLQEAARRPGARWKVLTLASDAQGWKTVLPFLRQRGIELPVALLTPQMRKSFRPLALTEALPQTLFFDCRGRLMNRIEGSFSKEDLDARIRSVPCRD